MKTSDLHHRIEALCTALTDLSPGQLLLVEQIVDQLREPFIHISRDIDSEIIDSCVLYDFGDTLRIHHGVSSEPFTKDKFEYAIEKVSNDCGKYAKLASKGNPGHDITIENEKISLKTQADRNIKEEKLHISKFMELGKGKWTDSIDDLIGLRTQFLEHMDAYDRIFSLRCLSRDNNLLHYELVEIPKQLLMEANSGNLRMMQKSRQNPKPGYCDVFDENQVLKFQLYFDGGTERKLQIKNLLKKHCRVHATWVFSIPDL